jgi:FemAB-related protein (PEP-CTERM system-associated)
MNSVVAEIPSTSSIGVPHAPTVGMLEQGSMASWDEFVQRCPQATFFHRAGWKTVIETAFRHRTYFLYAELDGVIQGVLPLAEIKSWLFGHSLSSLPFCAYGGIAADSTAASLALDQAAQQLARQLNVDHLEYRSAKAIHPDWAHKDLYVTFRKEIFADDEKNMLAIPRKQRAMVRKGIKGGLRSEIDASVDRFFALYSDNWHRHGTPALSKRYFQLLQEVFREDCEVLTVTDAEGHPLSSVLSFYFRNEVLPYYAGDDERAREHAANDFKYWELMRNTAARGCRVFDYGRSKIGTGSYAFKRNWGFEPVALPYEYQLLRALSVPDQNPLNPKYQVFIALWRKLPRVLVDRIGPHIVRSLG